MSWLFGKKSSGGSKSSTPSKGGNKFSGNTPTYETGRNVDSIIQNLFIRVNDPSPVVTKQVQESIQNIGLHEPLLLLSKGLKMLIKLRGNKKHKVLIMDELRKMIDENEVGIPEDLCMQLVRFSIAEIISEKSISSFWQNSAEMFLISIAMFKPQIVAGQLFTYFESNKIPHYFIIKSLADFSHRWPDLFFPFVKEVLAKALPLLTSIRQSNIKWVVSAGLGRWAENVVLYLRDNKDVSTAEYSGSFNTAVRHLLNHWMRERERKVKLSAAEAVGFMCILIEKDHLIELLPKLFAVYPKELKRESTSSGMPFAVAHGLKNIIYVVMRDAAEQIDPYVDVILQTLHTNLCFNTRNMKYAKREDTERVLLEGFQYLGQKCFYTDKITSFLAKFYDSPNVTTRVSTLRVLTHLVTHLQEELRSFKDTIVTSMNIMTQKMDYSVMYEMCRLVSVLGEAGYLSCQGGTDLVNIVVKTASITDTEIAQFDAKMKKKKMKPALTPGMVRDEGDKVLMKFVTPELAKHMDAILYPFLLEDFVRFEYTGSFAMLCHCLSTIAKRKKSDEDFLIDFEKSLNLPQPHILLARLFVMLCKPFERNESGVNILRAMYCISPNIRDTLVEVWSRKLPEMKKYVDTHTKDTYERDQWANLVLNLVRDSINSVDEDEWNVQLGEAIKEQAALYNNFPELKKNLLSIYGLIIQKTKYRDFVHKAIENIVIITNHSIQEERVGCARGLGQAATSHTDSVLTKLQSIMKAKEGGGGGGGGGLFGKKKKNTATMKVTHFTKATALLSYGYVCMLTPIGLINSRVEVHVVNNILPVLKVHKSSIIKELGLKSLDLVAKAVHPSRLKEFKLRSRDDIIKVILDVIRPMPKKKKKKEEFLFFYKLKVLGLEGLVRMIHLPPQMSKEIHESVIDEMFKLFKIDFGEFQVTVTENIHKVLSAILAADITEVNLDKILSALEPYTRSGNEMERLKSTETYIFVLKEFVNAIKTVKKKKVMKKEEKKEEKEEGEEKKEGEKKDDGKEKKDKGEKKKKVEEEEEGSSLLNLGRLLANFIPRMTESSLKVRENAYNCMYLIMRIQYFLKTGKTGLPDYIQQFKTVQKILSSTETKIIKKIIKIISVVLSKGIAEKYLITFVDDLLETLEDVEIDGARGSCVVLNGMVRSRGKELKGIVDRLVLGVIMKMQKLAAHEKIVRGLLYSVRELAHHHLYVVINGLLQQDVPHSKEVKECIQIIASDSKLGVKVLEYFLDILNNGQMYDEERKRKGDKEIVILHCNSVSLSVMHAFSEILEVEEINALCLKNYVKILPTALLRIGASHYVSNNPPVDVSMKILANFMNLVKDADVLYEMNKKNVWDLLKTKDTYAEGVLLCTQAVCDERSALIRKIFDFVQPFNTRIHLGHKIGSICMISVLLNSVRNDKEMVQIAINELLRKTGVNEDNIVKSFCLRGLSNVIHHPKEILHTYVAPVSNALINCIEDKDEDIILETMRSVKTVFSVAEDQYVSGLLINLCIRLKPAFEKDNPEIRESSILLFGIMARFCKGSLGQLLINNVHTFIPTILVHLLDPEEKVRLACKEALLQLVPELGSKKLVQVFKDYDDFEDFDAFAEEFAKVFVKEFPDYISDFLMNTVLFFKSKWDEIIIAAVLITGNMFFYLGDRHRSHVNMRHTVNGFCDLMKNKNPKIREKTAKILGNLYKC